MKVKIYGYQNSEGKIINYKDSLVKSECQCALEILADIPDELNPYVTCLDEICIEPKDDIRYLLNDVLYADKNGNPFVSYETNNSRITRKISSKELGWVSTSMTL